MRLSKYLFAAGLLVASACIHAQQPASDINESVTSIEVSVKDLYGRDGSGKVVITQFKPAGNGPFPILILNHGRANDRHTPPRFRYLQQARYFVSRGFAVFEPTRIGYGELGTQFDPEDSGNCNARDFAPMAKAGSTEILAVLDYAKRQAYADPKRVLLVGQSVGGYLTVATAARNPDGLAGAINFAGGAGGDPVAHPGNPCGPQRMEAMYAGFGKTAKVPMLWIYTENDLFFGPVHSRAWSEAFIRNGGKAEYHLLPPFAKNGHTLFGNGVETWEPVVSAFLDKIGFPAEK